MATKLFAGLLSSSIAGLAEIYLFHPLDTVVKRLQTDKTAKTEKKKKGWNETIFGEEAKDKPLIAKYRNLLPGLESAVAYKVIQRSYKFGLQPIVRDVIAGAFGPSSSSFLSEAVAGSIVGAGEVALLPLDALKVKMQASAEARRRGVVAIAREEGVARLYSGALWTIARNVPGSFALFGVSWAVKSAVFGLGGAGGRRGVKKATLGQHFVASLAGSVASILVSAPMDTVKTRIQVDGKASVSRIVREEGVLGLWKGTSVKLAMTAPKLVFTMTFSGWLSAAIQNALK